ncbi:MAG: sialate O-acetylesterase [Bryobacterales bacterium]|nr:sialate O-acetylesterase [Bryobacterales bacterium]
MDQVYVGDIWVLAGQSNMVGRARMDKPEQPHEKVRMQLEDGKWKKAEEPLHERKEGPDGEALGAGPGLTFAREMVERSGVPIGLIPCAKGGTNLTQWDPAKKGLGRGSLYGALMERVAAAGGRVAGILWYQGEADSRDTRASLYAERFRQLVASLRADLHAPGLLFYYAQLARFAGEELAGHTVESEEIVREAQRKSEAEIANTRMVATIDLELGDHIHLDAAGQRRMGKRFAAIVCSDRFPGLAACPAAKRGPRLAGANWESPYLLRIRFADVNGALRSSGRVLGFSIADEAGRARQLLFRADLQGADVVLSFNRLYPFPRGMSLWYGRGFDPACNLTDESDLAVPAFGPVELPQRPVRKGDKDAVNPQ